MERIDWLEASVSNLSQLRSFREVRYSWPKATTTLLLSDKTGYNEQYYHHGRACAQSPVNE